jgi:hypothetical protein
MEIRVPGLHAKGVDGVAGRSVVLYAGPRITQARPDVPNQRIACGVFQPGKPLQFSSGPQTQPSIVFYSAWRSSPTEKS